MAEIKVFYSRFNTTDQAAILKKWLPFLPTQLQQINAEYQLEADRARNLIGKLLLNKALRETGYHTILLENLKYTTYKKPYLSTEFDFSISHSGAYVLCAFSEKSLLGVDIEQIKTFDIQEVADMMSIHERVQISSAKNPVKEFYKIWTLKEAAIKAEGSGFSTNLHQKLRLLDNRIQLENQNWYTRELMFDEQYVAHLVSSSPIDTYELICINFE